MLFLIGVNHNAQRHPPGTTLDQSQASLQLCLEAAINEHRPSVIAVEESDDTLLNRKTGVADESIPLNVAAQHGIECVFCEPPDDEKLRIGYKDKSQILLELSMSGHLNDLPSSQYETAAHAVEMALIFPIREDYWIQKLRTHLQSELLVVIGEDHIESFGRRLEVLGIESKVLCRGIGVSDEQKVQFEDAKNFPAVRPTTFGAMMQYLREE